jgi:hypothetical protein
MTGFQCNGSLKSKWRKPKTAYLDMQSGYTNTERHDLLRARGALCTFSVTNIPPLPAPQSAEAYHSAASNLSHRQDPTLPCRSTMSRPDAPSGSIDTAALHLAILTGNTEAVKNSSSKQCNMHDLMAGAEVVVSARKVRLWKLKQSD